MKKEYDGNLISNIDKMSNEPETVVPEVEVELDDVIYRLKYSDRNVSNQKVVINGTIGLNIKECENKKCKDKSENTKQNQIKSMESGESFSSLISEINKSMEKNKKNQDINNNNYHDKNDINTINNIDNMGKLIKYIYIYIIKIIYLDIIL